MPRVDAFRAVPHQTSRPCHRRRLRGGLCEGTSYMVKNRELAEYFDSFQDIARTEFKALIFQVFHQDDQYVLPAYVGGDVPGEFAKYTQAIWPQLLGGLYDRENPLNEIVVYWDAEYISKIKVFGDACPNCREV